MRRTLAIILLAFVVALGTDAQTALKKVYDEDVNPIQQIDRAVAKAKAEGKFVVCQVGGNWCPWCLIWRGHYELNIGLKALEA